MFWHKSEIEKIQYDFLHDAIYNINRILPSFRFVCMDGNGELALTFDGELTQEQIKDVLFELRPFGPYDPAPVGPSAEKLDYRKSYVYKHCWAYFEKRVDSSVLTEIYSRDGIDYRKVN